MITASMVKDYFFCKRLIYFKHVLCLDEVITEKMKEGLKYDKIIERKLKKFDFLKLEKNKKLFKPILVYEDLKGIPDAVLFFDKEASPLEFKKGLDKVSYYYKYQLLFYGYLIEKNFNFKVYKGFIWFEDFNKISVVNFKEKEKDVLFNAILDVKEILNKGYMPKGSNNCKKCSFRNVCERY